ncbi:WD40-repeat-containing domain protein [Pavlovales sp. CCMP2436]|nr:WD40-repeat-containing domain protein [Pavlovales sp. CCMP2436]
MQLATLFSPDGAHLVCAGSSGHVHVWDVEQVLLRTAAGANPAVCTSFAAHGNAIYSLQFVTVKGQQLLVTGGDTDIAGWAWPLEACAGGGAPTPAFRLEHPRSTGLRGSVGALAECNALAFDPKSGLLFTAAGDSNAYAWDLGTGLLARTFSGHDGYLHCVAARPYASQIVTGSEDGTARLWDVRSTGSAAILRPPGESCGWCACAEVDATEDWLVCGWGAGVLTTWSLTAQTCTAAMPTGAPPQQLRFGAHSQSSVLSVGAEPIIYEWSLSGSLVQRITCASTSLFGVDSSTALREGGLIAVCGNAPQVQLFDATVGVVVSEVDTSE